MIEELKKEQPWCLSDEQRAKISANYPLIRKDTIRDLIGWAEHGGDTGGSFLHSVLVNNFMDAALVADPENASALQQIAQFIYNELPMDCWGSPKKVRAWWRKKKTERNAMERLSQAIAKTDDYHQKNPSIQTEGFKDQLPGK